jgi:hypothetical protein
MVVGLGRVAKAARASGRTCPRRHTTRTLTQARHRVGTPARLRGLALPTPT